MSLPIHLFPPVIHLFPPPVIHLFPPPVIRLFLHLESSNINHLALIFFCPARGRASRPPSGARRRPGYEGNAADVPPHSA
jgi:hypothetical protein